MRGRVLLGIAVVVVVAFGLHGQPPDKPKSGGEGQLSEAKPGTPEELEALNRASRKLYAGGRSLELSKNPVVIIVSGDDLILRKNGNRTVARVIPAEYHNLKCVAHSALAL